MSFENCINIALNFFENIDSIIFDITKEKETQDFLIDVLQDQLFTTGEDGNGLSLGEYSPVTVKIKTAKGQPTDRITLKDTGAFYNSYEIDPFEGGFFINADGIKEDTDLFFRYGEDILKPNQETTILIAEYYEQRLFEYWENIF
jgi:hypothetical protein